MGGTAQYEYEAVLDQAVNKQLRVCNLGVGVNNMRNIIFLDIDGVLNSNFWNKSHQREISDGSLIDVEKIKLLAELVRSTNAEIILHLGWRFWYDSDLKPLRIEALNLSELLVEEILLWVASHENINNWVVLEDLDLHNAIIEEHQVKIDQMTGLTTENVQEAKRILLQKN